MNKKIHDTYLAILKQELKPSLGCTEPIAIAYAGAKAREVLGRMPERCEVSCSGNIVKNVMGVIVPNSGGLKGIPVAATLGIVGGDAAKELAVLTGVTEAHIAETQRLLAEDFCTCSLVRDIPGLYILVRLTAGDESAEIEIKDYHSNITRIGKNGKTVFRQGDPTGEEKAEATPDKALLNVRDILEFADAVAMEEIDEVLTRQVECNSAIAREGLSKPYGAEVGRTLLDEYGTASVKLRAKAAAAAGSDARMSGCPLPVVINSGSGNQGITVTMPVLVYARELKLDREKTYRALVVSNLVALHQKWYIGSLSAYCGAVSAAAGSGAAIAWMHGASYEEIGDTITNTIANVGGMVCDGAKPSCAAKIASSVEAAVLGWNMSRRQHAFRPGEGLVKEDVEATIASVGRMGREGMKATDLEILDIMLENCAGGVDGDERAS